MIHRRSGARERDEAEESAESKEEQPENIKVDMFPR